MRRLMHAAGADIAHLFQFLHQVVLGMQASRRVNQQNIGAARFLAGPDRIIHNRARIGARPLADHLDAGALAPNDELINGRRAKCIGRSDHHLVTSLFVQPRQLTDAGRLT